MARGTEGPLTVWSWRTGAAARPRAAGAAGAAGAVQTAGVAVVGVDAPRCAVGGTRKRPAKGVQVLITSEWY